MKPRTIEVPYALVAVAFCLCVPGLFFAQNARGQQSLNGALSFFRGKAYFYEGEHAQAQAAFREYAKAHSDDLLVASRIILDRWLELDGEKDRTEKESDDLLASVNKAIALYEREDAEKAPCAATDLSIVQNTLDCAYIGESLYAYRMLIQWDFGSKWEAKKDYKTFLYLEGRSGSPQASFLLGLLEYKASESFWRRRGAGLFGIPHDRKDAIRLILHSLKGNASPFVDDINFFVFDSECGCTGHGDGVRDKDLEQYYPVDRLAELLHAEYPQNGHVSAFIDRMEAHHKRSAR